MIKSPYKPSQPVATNQMVNKYSISCHWRELPARARLVLLALATITSAALATVALLRSSGVEVILYKAF